MKDELTLNQYTLEWEMLDSSDVEMRSLAIIWLIPKVKTKSDFYEIKNVLSCGSYYENHLNIEFINEMKKELQFIHLKNIRNGY